MQGFFKVAGCWGWGGQEEEGAQGMNRGEGESELHSLPDCASHLIPIP